MKMVKVAVIGCGTMGAKIACELALHGHHVALHDSNSMKLNLARETIENDRLQLVKDGLPKFLFRKGSILYMDSLKLAVHNSDIIFESVVEDLNVKRNIFREIKAHCPPSSIICSGTISLNLDSIVEHMENPERTLGVRFLYPVLCIPEVEVVKNSFSSQDVIAYVSRFLCDMGKIMISRKCEPFALTEKEAALRKARYLEKFSSGQILTCSKAGDNLSHPLPSSASASLCLNLSFSSSSVTPATPSVQFGHLESSASSPSSRECAICMDAERDTLLCPCRHLLTCSSCSWSLIVNQEACPICRAPIKEILHVFHS